MSVPPKNNLRTFYHAAIRPSWSFQTLTNGLPKFGTMDQYMDGNWHGTKKSQSWICRKSNEKIFRLGLLKRNNGGKAIVTDGPIRDYNGVIETKVPCFCTGINPNSPYNSGPAKIGFPITIGGMSVKSGDLIVGDIDGVAVVPFERINEIATKVQRVAEIEKVRDAEVQNGLKIPQKIVELINSDKVKYYD